MTQGLPRTAVACLFLIGSPLAHAQAAIYRCPDASGVPVYTNSVNSRDAQSRGCKVVERPISTVPSQPTASSGIRAGVPSRATVVPRTATAAASDTGGFPQVDNATQRRRDGTRRQILEQELATEDRNLAQAKRELTEQEAVRYGDERNYQKVLDRLKPFQERVEQHERNVQAIRKELANLN